MPSKKVILIVAYEGYQPVEYGTPKRLLEEAGFTVITASNASGTAIASDKSTTKVDLKVDEIKPNKYEGIFFIGGPGAMENLDNEASYVVARKAVELNKPLGAICVSTRILAKAGVLKGREATGWNGDDEMVGIYEKHGVTVNPKDVVVDGNIITTSGPVAAQSFGEAIITLLQEQRSWG